MRELPQSPAPGFPVSPLARSEPSGLPPAFCVYKYVSVNDLKMHRKTQSFLEETERPGLPLTKHICLSPSCNRVSCTNFIYVKMGSEPGGRTHRSMNEIYYVPP